MGRKSRQKGTRFELEVARLLSCWWRQPDAETLKADQLWFRRVPLSGGFCRAKAPSDVWAVAEEAQNFPFCVENKNQECWDWNGLMKRNEGWPVDDYWQQVLESSKSATPKKIPMLLFTKNLHPIYIRMSLKVWKLLDIIPIVKCIEKHAGISLFTDLTAIRHDVVVKRLKGYSI